MSEGIDICFFTKLRNCSSGKLCTANAERIRNASVMRGDDVHIKVTKVVQDLVDASHTHTGPVMIKVHKTCIDSYTSNANIEKCRKMKSSTDEAETRPKRMRTEEHGVFEFKKHCLFCPNISECILPSEYDSRVPI